MAYKHYSDEDKAVALAYLQAAGYPDKPGALKDAARHTGISARQLQRLYREQSAKPNDNLVAQKTFELKTAINEELASIFNAMGLVREDASYKDLATAAGIFTDKYQLLEGKPTSRVATVHEELAETPEDERAAVLAEAEQIIRDSAMGNPGSETQNRGAS